jgi:hypothetical protein
MSEPIRREKNKIVFSQTHNIWAKLIREILDEKNISITQNLENVFNAKFGTDELSVKKTRILNGAREFDEQNKSNINEELLKQTKEEVKLFSTLYYYKI